jgi:hypothetical protein
MATDDTVIYLALVIILLGENPLMKPWFLYNRLQPLCYLR